MPSKEYFIQKDIAVELASECAVIRRGRSTWQFDADGHEYEVTADFSELVLSVTTVKL